MTANPPKISQAFSLKPSLGHRIKMITIGVVCISAGVLMVLWANTPAERLVGYVSSGFFGLCLFGYLLLLLRGGPRVEIDQHGIYVQTSFADGLHLAWHEIDDIGDASVIDQDMIIITPRKEVAWRSRLPRLGRWLARLNRSMGLEGLLLARSALGNQYEVALSALKDGLAQAHQSKVMKN